MVPAWLAAIIPNIVNSAKEYLNRKQRIRELETGAEIRIKEAEIESRIRRAESADKADGAIDRISVENTGWKDEYLLLITTFPLIMCMISPFADLILFGMVGEQAPGAHISYSKGFLAEAVVTGFESMNSLPEYYWYGLAMVYVHSLGMRRLFNNLVEKFVQPK